MEIYCVEGKELSFILKLRFPICFYNLNNGVWGMEISIEMLLSVDESSIPMMQSRVTGSVLTKLHILGYKEDTKICMHFTEKTYLWDKS